MRIVWNESLRQTQQMLGYWENAGSRIPSFAKDARTLSLNVLASTGFRQQYDFQGSDEAGTGQVNTYRDALQTVLDSAIFLMLIPPKLLSVPFLPQSWRRIGKAARDFKQYMLQMLDEETELLLQGSKGTGNLITSFLKALDVHQKTDLQSKAVSIGDVQTQAQTQAQTTSKGLSVPEILGNFFVINFAGHDTTANTFAFCILLLAAHPEVQEWVGEELRDLTPDPSEGGQWEYAELFPKLKRCHAVFLETLRLYPPILALPKWTNDFPQTLKVRMGESAKQVVIPPRTNVSPSLLAVQTHPEYWKEPLVWRPERWVASSISISNNASTAQEKSGSKEKRKEEGEVLLPPTIPHTYFPWSDGPQNCPGEKFALVEGVAVLAGLLRGHRVNIVREGKGETSGEARERVMQCVEDCDMQLLLRMRDAERVGVSVVRIVS
jgi:cytochrome P450